MSPEQASGSGSLDERTDIYSLGCVLYEMLAGEPPFTGPTPQAVIARHVSERVPSLLIVRPAVPVAVAGVVEQALAKTPADRFPTAQEFDVALARAARPGAPVVTTSGPGRGVRRLLLGGAALLIAALIWRGVVAPRHTLAASRVIVFPLGVRSQVQASGSFGEDVATAVFTALGSTEYLSAVDGWRLLDPRQRADARLLAESDVRRWAVQGEARFAVTGSILRADSVRGMINLYDAVTDSTTSIPLALPADADAWTVGLHAAIAMLPRLIPAGGPVDLRGALGERSPPAVARYLRGEQAYRRGRFREALDYYKDAVAADSGFALAALKGAQAAGWDRSDADAGALIGIALAHRNLLSPRDQEVALGYRAYLAGEADTALRHFRAALDLERRRPEAWMALGEAYTHLVPDAGPLDSLAETAFRAARQLDTTFAPVLYHLTEIALRKGDVEEATRLLRQFRESEPDSTERAPLEIMLRCVRESPERVDWRWLVLRAPQWVVEAGRSLAVAGLHQPRCAEAAWRAVLAHDTVTGQAWRWGAFTGLQALLVAEGRTGDLRELLRRDTEFGPDRVGRLYILSALAGAPVEAEADSGAQELRRVPGADPHATRSAPSVALWHLGIWAAHRGRWAEARAIADTLARMDEPLMAKSVAAWAALARGDSAAALRLLLEAVPNATRTALQWQPWESLGGERMLLATLRFARGEYADGYRIAAGLDAQPVPYLMYLPASLVLRLKAAERLGDGRAAEVARRRLVALGREDLLKAR
jgi:tetratricopeptide (TPR) repeat protein